MSQRVFYDSTSIELNWNDVIGADLYHCQVVSDPDFVTIVDEDNALASSAFSFTDSGADNSKRWWRWRYSTDSGSTWSSWQEVGMYWIDTNAANDIDIASNKIAVFDIDDVTDIYQFESFPELTIIPSLIARGKVRNRNGELLSDYVTAKDIVTMKFEGSKLIRREQLRQILRFHVSHKEFFIAINIDDGVNEIPHIWKVELSEDAVFTPSSPNRNDLLEGELKLEEV